MLAFQLILSFILTTANTEQTDFKKVFGNDYTDGLEYINEISVEFKQVCEQYEVAPDLVFAMVFPETVRYSKFKDFFETAALELVYIEMGSEYVDFSIGHFQMKPSFAEKLERTIQQNEALKQLANSLQYTSVKEEEIRKQRLTRLKQERWQMLYAVAFTKQFMVNYWLENTGDAEKLKLLATAYNAPFGCDIQALLKRSEYTYFPYGTRTNMPQYRYADVSEFYLINDYK